MFPKSIGRSYIKNSLLCGAKFGDLKGGVYGWSGSVIDEHTPKPKGADSDCCGEFEEDIVTNGSLCNEKP